MVKVSLQYVIPAFGNGPDLRGSEILYFGRVPVVGELVEFVRKEDPATVYVFPVSRVTHRPSLLSHQLDVVASISVTL